MKKYFLPVIFIFLIFCENHNNDLKNQSRYLYNLPLNADIYFKLNASFFSRFENLFKLYRIKQLDKYFKSIGVNLSKNVEYIYGGYKIQNPRQSAFLITGKFNNKRIEDNLKKKYKELSGHGYKYFKPLRADKYSVGIKNANRLIFSYQDRMLKKVPHSSRIFHALNILKRVNYSEQNWILIYCTQNFKKQLKKYHILEILSLASFYSVSIKPGDESKNILYVEIRIYISEKTYTGEIVTTLENYFNQLRSTYSLLNKSVYNISTFYKDNFARISFTMDISSVKISK